MFADWLPFETSTGTMRLGEYRKANDVIRYVPNLDQFRQVARVAAARVAKLDDRDPRHAR